MGLRINFVDVIIDNSLKNVLTNSGEKVGFQFDIQLSNYRGHYLSCIDEFELRIDDEIIDPNIIRFCINGKQFPVNDLKYLRSEYWNLLNPATIKVINLDGLDSLVHSIDLKLILRVPYMPIPIGEHNYVPLDSSGIKSMKVGG